MKILYTVRKISQRIVGAAFSYFAKYRYTFVIIFEGYYNTMEFQIDKRDGKARACTIKTVHSTIQTPVFMPVGTVGAVKACTS